MSLQDPNPPLVYPPPPAYVRRGGLVSMLRLFGPGAIIASVTIGSGETFFASRAGAILGYGVLWFIVLFMTALISALTFGLAFPLMIMMLAGTGLIYRWLMLWHRSATLGMMATGIEVRDRNGEKCDPTTAFLHSLAFIGTLYLLPLAIIGWILMASSPHGRAMHDMMVKTVVINRPA